MQLRTRLLLLFLLGSPVCFGQGRRIQDLPNLNAEDVDADNNILFGISKLDSITTPAQSYKLSLEEFVGLLAPRQSVSTVAGLATANVQDGAYVVLRGYNAIDDGGGGLLRYQISDTRPYDAQADNILQFDGPGGTGWFVRVLDTPVITAEMAGADRTGATDCTTEIQAWLTYAGIGGYPESTRFKFEALGRYLISDTVTLTGASMLHLQIGRVDALPNTLIFTTGPYSGLVYDGTGGTAATPEDCKPVLKLVDCNHCTFPVLALSQDKYNGTPAQYVTGLAVVATDGSQRGKHIVGTIAVSNFEYGFVFGLYGRTLAGSQYAGLAETNFDVFENWQINKIASTHCRSNYIGARTSDGSAIGTAFLAQYNPGGASVDWGPAKTILEIDSVGQFQINQLQIVQNDMGTAQLNWTSTDFNTTTDSVEIANTYVGGECLYVPSVNSSPPYTMPSGLEAGTPYFVVNPTSSLFQLADTAVSINATFNATSDRWTTAADHGLRDDQRVHLTTSGTLPAGYATATTYYVIDSFDDPRRFQLSATEGGSAVNGTDAGTGTHTCAGQPIDITSQGSGSWRFYQVDGTESGIQLNEGTTLTIRGGNIEDHKAKIIRDIGTSDGRNGISLKNISSSDSSYSPSDNVSYDVNRNVRFDGCSVMGDVLVGSNKVIHSTNCLFGRNSRILSSNATWEGAEVGSAARLLNGGGTDQEDNRSGALIRNPRFVRKGKIELYNARLQQVVAANRTTATGVSGNNLTVTDETIFAVGDPVIITTDGTTPGDVPVNQRFVVRSKSTGLISLHSLISPVITDGDFVLTASAGSGTTYVWRATDVVRQSVPHSGVKSIQMTANIFASFTASTARNLAAHLKASGLLAQTGGGNDVVFKAYDVALDDFVSFGEGSEEFALGWGVNWNADSVLEIALAIAHVTSANRDILIVRDVEGHLTFGNNPGYDTDTRFSTHSSANYVWWGD